MDVLVHGATATATDADTAAADPGGVRDIEPVPMGLMRDQEAAEAFEDRWSPRRGLHRPKVAQAPDSDRSLGKNRSSMDLGQSGARSIEPLLVRAVGEPAVAAAGREEIDRVLDATERVVAEIVDRSRAQARSEAAEMTARSEAEVAARAADLRRLKIDLLDQATLLAQRFEGLLDQLDLAEAGLTGLTSPRSASGTHVPAAPEASTAAVRAPPQPGQLTPIEQPRVLAPARRRWWRLWAREAA